MKIYFTASSKHKDKNLPIYQSIVNHLEKKGHDVFEKILSGNLPKTQQISSQTSKTWHQEQSSYINDCDLVVVEGSYPSTIHIGFELFLCLSKNKPTILLFQANQDPVLINQIYSNRLIKSEYTPSNLTDVIDWCLEEAEKLTDKRFTFYISPKIDNFLEAVADKNNISRSEFIRKLINQAMKKTNS